MINPEWKKKRRDAFVRYMVQSDEYVESTERDIVWLNVLVDLLLDDLSGRYAENELMEMLGDNISMLDRYIAFLQTRLELGSFSPSN